MTNVTTVLEEVGGFLKSQNIEWYVFGAQAVVVFGRPRMTVDIDVTLNLSLDKIAEFVDKLLDAGFSVDIADPVSFGRRTRVIPAIHHATGIPVDLVLAGPGLEQEFLQRAVPIEIGGISVPFISPEDLVITKLLAGRDRDLEDVEGILSSRGNELDEGLIREVLGRIEAALDRSDLISAFDDLKGEV